MTERATPEPRSPGDVAAPAAAAATGAPSATRGFLFADLRDYTAYVEVRGDRAGAALLERYRGLVREAVATAHGAEIRTEGDSFYVVFGSVAAAVRCGLAIVDTAAAATAGDADPIRVGVGVHAGETVETAEGFVGSAVNIAARLCTEAKAGEVVVSETVRGLVRTQVELDFVPLGARRLKGVAEPVPCYRVVARSGITGHPRPRPSARGRRPRLLAAGVGLAVVAVIAVGAAVLGGGLAVPAPTPGPSGAALASPSVAASVPATSAASAAPTASPTSGPFPNEVEAAILAALPPTLVSTCRRGGTADDARLAGFEGTYRRTPTPGMWQGDFPVTPTARAGVTCQPPAGADRLYVMEPMEPKKKGDWSSGYATAAADEYLGRLAGRWKIPSGSCAAGAKASERWRNQRATGLLACMEVSPYDGRPWIYFTFGDGRYLAFATRDDPDYEALYAWFDNLTTFLP